MLFRSEEVVTRRELGLAVVDADEELRAVRVGTRVRHRDGTDAVLARDGLVGELVTGTAAPGIFKGAWEFSKSFGVGKDYSQAAVDKYIAARAVRSIDPETVEFSLAQPYAAFISDMATFMGSIVSPAYVTAHWKKPSDPQRGFMPGVTAGQRDDWMLYNASGTGDRKSTRLNSSHRSLSRMPSSA